MRKLHERVEKETRLGASTLSRLLQAEVHSLLFMGSSADQGTAQEAGRRK